MGIISRMKKFAMEKGEESISEDIEKMKGELKTEKEWTATAAEREKLRAEAEQLRTRLSERKQIVEMQKLKRTAEELELQKLKRDIGEARRAMRPTGRSLRGELGKVGDIGQRMLGYGRALPTTPSGAGGVPRAPPGYEIETVPYVAKDGTIKYRHKVKKSTPVIQPRAQQPRLNLLGGLTPTPNPIQRVPPPTKPIINFPAPKGPLISLWAKSKKRR